LVLVLLLLLLSIGRCGDGGNELDRCFVVGVSGPSDSGVIDRSGDRADRDDTAARFCNRLVDDDDDDGGGCLNDAYGRPATAGRTPTTAFGNVIAPVSADRYLRPVTCSDSDSWLADIDFFGFRNCFLPDFFFCGFGFRVGPIILFRKNKNRIDVCGTAGNAGKPDRQAGESSDR
jgi:hypothetical protein